MTFVEFLDKHFDAIKEAGGVLAVLVFAMLFYRMAWGRR